MSHNIAIYSSPIGLLAIHCSDKWVISIQFTQSTSIQKRPRNALMQEIFAQLDHYFSGQSQSFNLPLSMDETPFRQQVYSALIEIPYGETRTYKQLASKLNTAPRAVGQACRHNPFMIVVPCHRIVAVNHDGGYAGNTSGPLMNIKRWLLQHEYQHQVSPDDRSLGIAYARERMLCI